MGSTGFDWVIIGLTGFDRCFTGFYWVLLGFTGFYWFIMVFVVFNEVLIEWATDETNSLQQVHVIQINGDWRATVSANCFFISFSISFTFTRFSASGSSVAIPLFLLHPFYFHYFFFQKRFIGSPHKPNSAKPAHRYGEIQNVGVVWDFFFLFFKFLSALSSIITRLSLIHFCFVLFFFCVSFFFNFCFYIVAVSVRLFFDVGGSRSAAPVGGVPLRPRRRRRPIRWRNKRETNRAKRKKKAPPAHRRWPIDPHQHGSLYADRTGHRSRPKKRKTKSKKKRKSKNGRSQKKKTLPRSESSTRCRVDQ